MLITNPWHHIPYVHCTPNRSKLTLGSCRVNQEEGLKAARQLLADEHVMLIPEHQIERLMACSVCEHCRVRLSISRVKRTLVREFKRVANELERVDWHGKDNEVKAMRERAYRRQRYQERKGESK